MNKCLKCGTEFEGKFCPECGNPSTGERLCPNCKTLVPIGAKFCTECGHSLPSMSIPTSSTVKSTPPTANEYDTRAALKSSVSFREKIKAFLKYIPAVLLLLFSLLVWAFYAAPVFSANILIGTIEGNLYQIYAAEISEFYALILSLFICSAVIFIVAFISLFAAAKSHQCLSALLALISLSAFFILGIILTVKIGQFGMQVGACPILILVFSCLFVIIVVGVYLYEIIKNPKSSLVRLFEAIRRSPSEFLHKALLSLPAALLLLYSLLLWAFYAAPVLETDVDLVTVQWNLYKIFGGSSMQIFHAITLTLFFFSVISTLIAVFSLSASFKYLRSTLWITFPLYLIFSVLGTVLIVFVYRLEANLKACPLLILIFAVVFAILNGVSLLCCAELEKKLPQLKPPVVKFYLLKWIKKNQNSIGLFSLSLICCIITTVFWAVNEAATHNYVGRFYLTQNEMTHGVTAYIELDEENWKDNQGNFGHFIKSGENIALMIEQNGAERVFAQGTITTPNIFYGSTCELALRSGNGNDPDLYIKNINADFSYGIFIGFAGALISFTSSVANLGIIERKQLKQSTQNLRKIKK